jgi:hypothetical protein
MIRGCAADLLTLSGAALASPPLVVLRSDVPEARVIRFPDVSECKIAF